MLPRPSLCPSSRSRSQGPCVPCFALPPPETGHGAPPPRIAAVCVQLACISREADQRRQDDANIHGHRAAGGTRSVSPALRSPFEPPQSTGLLMLAVGGASVLVGPCRTAARAARSVRRVSRWLEAIKTAPMRACAPPRSRRRPSRCSGPPCAPCCRVRAHRPRCFQGLASGDASPSIVPATSMPRKRKAPEHLYDIAGR